MSDGVRRLFVGVKISTQLQTGLNSPAPGTDRYFKEDNGEYLQIINQGEDKFIGRYLKDGFPIGDLDNVSRNVRSIIRLIAGDHRIEEEAVRIYGGETVGDAFSPYYQNGLSDCLRREPKPEHASLIGAT